MKVSLSDFQSKSTGLMLDSGTTLTYFTKSLYQAIVSWISKVINDYNKTQSGSNNPLVYTKKSAMIIVNKKMDYVEFL